MENKQLKNEILYVLRGKNGFGGGKMKTLSDATLKSMTKSELIEQLRIAEHNYAVAKETIEQQAKNFKNYEPVMYGEWIDVGDFMEVADGTELPFNVCSACGEYVLLGKFKNFCPNCGAIMRSRKSK